VVDQARLFVSARSSYYLYGYGIAQSWEDQSDQLISGSARSDQSPAEESTAVEEK